MLKGSQSEPKLLSFKKCQLKINTKSHPKGRAAFMEEENDSFEEQDLHGEGKLDSHSVKI